MDLEVAFIRLSASQLLWMAIMFDCRADMSVEIQGSSWNPNPAAAVSLCTEDREGIQPEQSSAQR